jgi:hypothetical protein
MVAIFSAVLCAMYQDFGGEVISYKKQAASLNRTFRWQNWQQFRQFHRHFWQFRADSADGSARSAALLAMGLPPPRLPNAVQYLTAKTQRAPIKQRKTHSIIIEQMSVKSS